MPDRPASPGNLSVAATQEEGPSAEHVLRDILTHRFGFSDFRPHQEAVCAAVVAGNDALLVMPTGAGKSLCYQLPGIARGGTTLVISPLIALIEDQVAALRIKGFRAERIHSNRSREESRAVCLRYLGDDLDFLFIAPERLSVPGFPEFLARRPPCLVAIDEAHCISHWGHDFRPEYRLIGQRIPPLRPVPVIALTATATGLVQRDIVAQLGLQDPRLFIHGFRRTNIAIAVEQTSKGKRPERIIEILTHSKARPAIVYTRSRKDAESIAEAINERFPALAAYYHAGMTGESRQRVHQAFRTDAIGVVVATVAFGMGIDKPDIRTVIHAGMPDSLEAYYQEIGRAGRDALPCRAILLTSYGDRKLNEFLIERSYPDIPDMQRVFEALGASPTSVETLCVASSMKEEDCSMAVQKLWLHGGAVVDSDGLACRGTDQWRTPYRQQRDHRLVQLDQVQEFIDEHRCRILLLLRHFNYPDSMKPCGVCDRCDPGQGSAEKRDDRVPLSLIQRQAAETIVARLRGRNYMAAGKLAEIMAESHNLNRKEFEKLLDALCVERIVEIVNATFEADGVMRRYRQVSCGPACLGDCFAKALDTARAAPAQARSSRPSRSKEPLPAQKVEPRPTSVVDSAVLARLREFRRTEAARQHVPPFQIMHDRTLRLLAATLPSNEEELLATPGIGPRRVARYGAQILAACHPTHG